MEHGNEAGIVTGSVVGSIVFVIIVVAVIIVICRRRRYYSSRVVVSPANQQPILTSTAAYSGGVVNPNYPNSASYTDQKTTRTEGVMNSYPPQYGAKFSHPPPDNGSTTHIF